MSHFNQHSICVNSKDDSKLLPLSIAWGVVTGTRPKNSPRFQVFKGLDTLHIGLYVSWKSTELFSILEREKRLCQDDDFKNHSISVRGFENIIVYPSGKKGGYGWHISTGDIHVFFSRHSPTSGTPNVFIEIGSISCWERGIFDTLRAIEHFIMLYGGYIVENKINRVDLAVDFVGLDIHQTEIFDKEKWIKQAQDYHVYGKGRRDNSAAFGFSKSSVISLRIYDKMLELKDDPAKAAFFFDLWGMTIDNQLPVTRLEFQLRKDILKELQSKNFNNFVQNIQGVWEYLTSKWFRLGDSFDRKNTERAKNTPWWDIVNNVKWSEAVVYLERKALKAKKSIEPLIDQAAGLAMSVSAYLAIEWGDIDAIIKTFNDAVTARLTTLFEDQHLDFKHKYLTRQSACFDSFCECSVC
ncbi:hypothetical protein KAR91_40560 [Candidatus Pacearchaeota archaeon]|nr:hypothetical protein [Candidatus Pacearchaeota archaeon]